MTNVKEIKIKPIVSRNKMLVNIIKLAREILDPNESMVDAIMIVRDIKGYTYTIRQEISENTDDISMIGSMEFVKNLLLMGFEVEVPEDAS